MMGEWFDVKGRLPDNGGKYLCNVIVPKEGGGFETDYRVLLYCKYNNSWNVNGIIVTHWMELPDKPKINL